MENDDSWDNVMGIDNSKIKESGDTVVVSSTTDHSCNAGKEQQDSNGDLSESLQKWLKDAHKLATSEEMRQFLHSTQNVVVLSAGTGVKLALMPVTLPLGVAAGATRAVGHAVADVAHTTSSFCMEIISESSTATDGGEDTDGGGSQNNPITIFTQHAVHLIPLLQQATGRVQEEVGSTIVGLLPFLGTTEDCRESGGQGRVASDEQFKKSPGAEHKRKKTQAGQTSYEQHPFLERLQLDYLMKDSTVSISDDGDVSLPVSEKNPPKSRFLLHVYDFLSMYDQTSKVMFIDLENSHADPSISRMMDKMVSHALVLLGTSSCAGESNTTTWKPEGKTAQLEQKCCKDRTLLQREVLFWSGSLKGSRTPLFRARGMVKQSPRDFIDLLWDSNRAGEYNKWSMGRTDDVILNNSLWEGDGTVSSKIVSGETKVPLTNMSVKLLTLMYVVQLEDGYVLISRSLHSGLAGTHEDDSNVESQNVNELLWGINYLRAVEGQPEWTDLTTVSQVRSSVVPGFLAHRIGLLGVQDFFSAVRSNNNQ